MPSSSSGGGFILSLSLPSVSLAIILRFGYGICGSPSVGCSFSSGVLEPARFAAPALFGCWTSRPVLVFLFPWPECRLWDFNISVSLFAVCVFHNYRASPRFFCTEPNWFSRSSHRLFDLLIFLIFPRPLILDCWNPLSFRGLPDGAIIAVLNSADDLETITFYKFGISYPLQISLIRIHDTILV